MDRRQFIAATAAASTPLLFGANAIAATMGTGASSASCPFPTSLQLNSLYINIVENIDPDRLVEWTNNCSAKDSAFDAINYFSYAPEDVTGSKFFLERFQNVVLVDSAKINLPLQANRTASTVFDGGLCTLLPLSTHASSPSNDWLLPALASRLGNIHHFKTNDDQVKRNKIDSAFRMLLDDLTTRYDILETRSVWNSDELIVRLVDPESSVGAIYIDKGDAESFLEGLLSESMANRFDIIDPQLFFGFNVPILHAASYIEENPLRLRFEKGRRPASTPFEKDFIDRMRHAIDRNYSFSDFQQVEVSMQSDLKFYKANISDNLTLLADGGGLHSSLAGALSAFRASGDRRYAGEIGAGRLLHYLNSEADA